MLTPLQTFLGLGVAIALLLALYGYLRRRQRLDEEFYHRYGDPQQSKDLMAAKYSPQNVTGEKIMPGNWPLAKLEAGRLNLPEYTTFPPTLEDMPMTTKKKTKKKVTKKTGTKKVAKKKTKKKSKGKARSARTGEYVTKKYARRHKDTTVIERK